MEKPRFSGSGIALAAASVLAMSGCAQLESFKNSMQSTFSPDTSSQGIGGGASVSKSENGGSQPSPATLYPKERFVASILAVDLKDTLSAVQAIASSFSTAVCEQLGVVTNCAGIKSSSQEALRKEYAVKTGFLTTVFSNKSGGEWRDASSGTGGISPLASAPKKGKEKKGGVTASAAPSVTNESGRILMASSVEGVAKVEAVVQNISSKIRYVILLQGDTVSGGAIEFTSKDLSFAANLPTGKWDSSTTITKVIGEVPGK